MEDTSGNAGIREMGKWEPTSDRINVGEKERMLSTVGGAAIAIYGLSQKSLPGLALAAAGGMLLRRGISGHCPLYDAANIDTTTTKEDEGVHIVESMTIRCPRGEVYQAWHEFEKLPRFMRHIESVDKIDDKTTEWQAPLPKGLGTLSWKAEMTEDEPDHKIAWRSLPESDLRNAGCVTFKDAPGDRGTEIKVNIEYRPPAGSLGKAAAGLVNPAFSKMIRGDLRRFKALMETGEIPTIEGQPSGG